ncbi:hypothetical protein BDP55DRAFT_682160 [Colletotrichum godetiae]|uniref:Secreted protein n=1 Tax=Colletotrichum godetiae TaxID=1209918 RepID=A0AAJ0A8R3_9PEZI|nr:uncharacterized protein BDP55DRAFT_682160 [Colletotrichum godetiae]KAK1658611.1 hypothetical protein BDP55DRAFT_682160 [Colletotrichum godetiae]
MCPKCSTLAWLISFNAPFSTFLSATLFPSRFGRRVRQSSTSQQPRNFEHDHLAVIVVPGFLLQGNLAAPKF